MKKLTKKIAVVALSALTGFSALSLSSCFLFEDDEALSAYEIAVENGFEGTEQEWLASLKGNKGEDGKGITIKDLYEASGFEGTLEEFIVHYIKDIDVTLQEDNDTEMLANNAASVVSICSGYQKKTTIREGWLRVEKTKVSGVEGSGVIYKIETNGEYTEAYIITNYHVVYGGSEVTDNEDGISSDIYVYTYGAREQFTLGDEDGDKYLDDGKQIGDEGDGIRATFVGGAMDYDIAILKISDKDYLPKNSLTEATFGTGVVLGEKSFVIGNANGHGVSVTSGAISVESETIYMDSTDGNRTVDYRVVRTDAAINHGNSGGGLFNAKGELVGIINAKSIEKETDNMGYALPISQVKAVVDNILSNTVEGVNGYVSRAWLGIETYLQSSIASLVDGKIEIKETFLVNNVFTDSKKGAGQGKFQYLDVFKSLKINDGEWTELTRRYQLEDEMLKIRKGDVVTFRVLRENVETEIEITFDKDEYFIKYA